MKVEDVFPIKNHIFDLKINFTDSPVCARPTPSAAGVALDASVALDCRVAAHPQERLSFHWTFLPENSTSNEEEEEEDPATLNLVSQYGRRMSDKAFDPE